MKAKISGIAIVVAILFIISVVAAWNENSINGQPVPPKANAPVLRESFGTQSCRGCHECEGDTLRSYNEKDANGNIPAKFVRLDESRTWREQDLHSKAFENIDSTKEGNKLAKQMQRTLSQEPHRKAATGGNYRIEKAGECLACHADDQSWDEKRNGPAPINLEVINDGPKPRFLTGFGVSCEVCHGKAKDWFAPHQISTWRTVDVEDKKTKGLTDLRSPKLRAEKCASCHIGNKNEGKFVTHEMYAAGHPPLPSFEMATYSNSQPAHYRPNHVNEELKSMAQKDKAGVWKNFHFREDEQSTARDLAIGSLVAFRANVKLLAEEPDAAAKDSAALLDFAHFDCAACHHDLKHPNDRQNRDRGVAGRPLPKLSADLLDTVLNHAETSGGNPANLSEHAKAFRDSLKSLRYAFDERPFGNATTVQKIASKLATDCDELFKDLNEIVYDADKSRTLYQAIAARIQYYGEKKDGRLVRYLDHDDAQQLAWALLTLRGNLYPQLDFKGKEPDPIATARDKLAATLVLHLRPGHRDKDGSAVFTPFLKTQEERQKERGNILKKRMELQFAHYQAENFITAMDEWLKVQEPLNKP